MMTRLFQFTSYLALAALAVPAAAQPRSAAFETSADRSHTQPFLFSGATVRLSLDGRSNRRPEIAMRLTGATQTSGLMPKIGEGVAFSTVPGGGASLTLAGQTTRDLEKRLKMSDGATAALIVGGVVLVVGALAVIGANDAVDDINDDGGCC